MIIWEVNFWSKYWWVMRYQCLWHWVNLHFRYDDDCAWNVNQGLVNSGIFFSSYRGSDTQSILFIMAISGTETQACITLLFWSRPNLLPKLFDNVQSHTLLCVLLQSDTFPQSYPIYPMIYFNNPQYIHSANIGMNYNIFITFNEKVKEIFIRLSWRILWIERLTTRN